MGTAQLCVPAGGIRIGRVRERSAVISLQLCVLALKRLCWHSPMASCLTYTCRTTWVSSSIVLVGVEVASM